MRLIDADKLNAEFDFIADKYGIGEKKYISIKDIKMIIDKTPTVDDRPEDDTPAGTWIPEEETYTDLSGTIETYTRFKCDHCLQGQDFGPYPFCPWCGKKMNQEITKETKEDDTGRKNERN